MYSKNIKMSGKILNPRFNAGQKKNETCISLR
jgi:hypothetical protein